ncbi:hypothetical protein GGR54DRAFT_641082 [Hypoxylon sp. NC1633]|nr:hypothetical protein GGR54DRAFT_641082 [Hypoxylon sp. NC1633]
MDQHNNRVGNATEATYSTYSEEEENSMFVSAEDENDDASVFEDHADDHYVEGNGNLDFTGAEGYSYAYNPSMPAMPMDEVPDQDFDHWPYATLQSNYIELYRHYDELAARQEAAMAENPEARIRLHEALAREEEVAEREHQVAAREEQVQDHEIELNCVQRILEIQSLFRHRLTNANQVMPFFDRVVNFSYEMLQHSVNRVEELRMEIAVLVQENEELRAELRAHLDSMAE